ncbi:MAG: alpha-hydroxy-acid oxidizing enzyme [Candidatus Rokubacteria bacterium 13_1_40CM_69_27]|nr:MAG: alpha-hydroxy-acid oxidizing enzyme [Candidatus Rokubacteria bacterium 13_1_40CM_69_27]OLC38628.1 MAG: alpha-hydroxy-acid oxidizing enzyme [Candidatus Rokubacteria bacterium 13_1_40CM_4_69_5]
MVWAPLSGPDLIANPADAINVFDFEPVARKNVPPAHFGYMASGIDDEVTLRANREGFAKFQLRPRRLNDVSQVDMSTEIFGVTWPSPIGIAPTGGNKAYHPEGEVAVAKAARVGNHLQILSTPATTSVEAATQARGAPIWFQLYASPSWTVAQALVKRAEAAGCPVVALTVDRMAGRNQETLERLKRTDTRDCKACHMPGIQNSVRRKPNYDGIDLSGLRSLQSANLTWDFVRRLKDSTRMNVVLKGIVTHEDAKLCVENGVDGIIVSNHGARAEDSGRSSIECLPEVVDAIGGRIPVLIDSGFRRGTDIVKALALGAHGIFIGRPYLWGLGAFGQPGVERVLEILRTELRVAMQQVGVRSLKELTPTFVRRAG